LAKTRLLAGAESTGLGVANHLSGHAVGAGCGAWPAESGNDGEQLRRPHLRIDPGREAIEAPRGHPYGPVPWLLRQHCRSVAVVKIQGDLAAVSSTQVQPMVAWGMVGVAVDEPSAVVGQFTPAAQCMLQGVPAHRIFFAGDVVQTQ